MIKIAYFGTNDFSADFLEKLLNDKELPIEVVFVVTQPDKPMGKKQILTPMPVKILANKYSVSSYFIPEEYEPKLKEVDIALLFSYGEILKKSILEAPKYGFWNIHPSLLPRYRNVSPMAFPLVLGDKETGTTIIQLDEKLDHGPVIAQARMPIAPNDKRPDLEKKLSNLSYDLFKKTITDAFDSKVSHEQNTVIHIHTREQDHTKATFTKLLKKEYGFIPFPILLKMLHNDRLQPEEFPQILREYWKKYPHVPTHTDDLTIGEILYNLYRGLYPWPGLWTLVNINGQEKRLKLTEISLEKDKAVLQKVQLEGKNEVDVSTFNRAYKVGL